MPVSRPFSSILGSPPQQSAQTLVGARWLEHSTLLEITLDLKTLLLPRQKHTRRLDRLILTQAPFTLPQLRVPVATEQIGLSAARAFDRTLRASRVILEVRLTRYLHVELHISIASLSAARNLSLAFIALRVVVSRVIQLVTRRSKDALLTTSRFPLLKPS